MKKYAGVIVRKGDKCLFCKRNADMSKFSGEWSIPGGSVEKGEEILHAAQREFYEETDYELETPINFLGVIKRMNREGTKQKGMMYVFGTDVENEINPDLENAIDGEEHSECGYFGVDELPEPMNETLREFVNTFMK
jgi:ADP-ribose pyrophosphatase YjhB (NUDIX family)